MTRQESARINGTLSHGPVTPEGKARSSQNAIRHGFHARSIVLAHESQSDFEALHADFRARWNPVGEVEHDLVLSLAAARWRLRRIEALESAVFEQEIQRIANDPENPVDPRTAISIAYANLAAGTALNRLHKYESRLLREFQDAERQLLLNQQLRAENDYSPAGQNEPEVLASQPQRPAADAATHAPNRQSPPPDALRRCPNPAIDSSRTL